MSTDRPGLDKADAFPELRLLVSGKPARSPQWRLLWQLWLLAAVPAIAIAVLADIEITSVSGFAALAGCLVFSFTTNALYRRFTTRRTWRFGHRDHRAHADRRRVFVDKRSLCGER